MIDLAVAIVVDDDDEAVTTHSFDLKFPPYPGQIRFTDC